MSKTNIIGKEMRDKIQAVLRSKKVFEIISDELTEGSFSMNVNDVLKLEIQEDVIVLVNKRSGEVANAYNTVDKALEGDNIFKFIESYRLLPVHIDDKGYITINNEEFDSDAIGVWTDGFKFMYIDTVTNELYFNEYSFKEEDFEELGSVDFIEFDDYVNDDELSELFGKIREYILKPENADLLETLKVELEEDNRYISVNLRNAMRELNIFGLCAGNPAKLAHISDIVSEFYSTKTVSIITVITNDNASVVYSKDGSLDVVREFEPNFELLASTELNADILNQVFDIVEELLASQAK